MAFMNGRFGALSVGVLLVAGLGGQEAQAQMPGKFTNLQVLPRETGRADLVARALNR